MWRADTPDPYQSPPTVEDHIKTLESIIRRLQLLVDIYQSPQIGDVRLLWATNQRTWTTAHTAAAEQRKQQLRETQGET